MSLALDDNLRRALGSALRTLDERIALAKKLEQEASLNGRAQIAKSWAAKVREFAEEANVIRSSIRRTEEIAARLAE